MSPVSNAFILHQSFLQALAFNMVGSLADAEDIVQDTFLKWLSVEHQKIENTKAYLAKAVINNCLKHLENKKKINLHPTQEHCAELPAQKEDFTHFDLENELSEALAILQAKLTPVEKAVYLLREVFNLEYEELQGVFNKKTENLRQLFCRAKQNLEKETQRFKVDMSRHAELLTSFRNACHFENPYEFICELSQDIAAKFK